MKFLKFVFVLTILNLLFISCESIEIKGIEMNTANKLVIYSFFNPDSVWSVQVSRMGNIMDLESVDLTIKDAKVVLFEGNNPIDTFKHSTRGNYFSTRGLRPEYGSKYHLEITCDGFERVISESEMLPDSNIIVQSTIYDYLLKDVFPAETYTMNQWFKQISVESKIKVGNHQLLKIYALDSLQCQSVTLSRNATNSFVSYNSLESNLVETIDSGELLLQIAVSKKCHKLIICTVSHNYFLYEISRSEYDFVVNTTYLLSPNNIYSNILGGAGVFVGYTENVVSLSI